MKTKITIAVALLTLAASAVQIETVTCYSHHTNSVEASGVAGKIVFTATGRNLDVYSSLSDVAILIPTVTNSTFWAATNVIGATWKNYDRFAQPVDATRITTAAITNNYGGVVKTYQNIFKENEVVVLRFVSTTILTNTVKLLIY